MPLKPGAGRSSSMAGSIRCCQLLIIPDNWVGRLAARGTRNSALRPEDARDKRFHRHLRPDKNLQKEAANRRRRQDTCAQNRQAHRQTSNNSNLRRCSRRHTPISPIVPSACALATLSCPRKPSMGWRRPTNPAVASVYASKDRPKINAHMSCRRAGRLLNWGFSTPKHAVWPSVSAGRSRLSCAVCRLPCQRTGKRRSPDAGPYARPQCRARIAREAARRGPSANPSGQLSPSQARHVSAICRISTCSTVRRALWGSIDHYRLSGRNPTLLRVGGLSRNARKPTSTEACRVAGKC